MVNLIILALAMLVFYFLMIRPKNRQIKKQREFLNKLERGLRIVTTAGIHGRISRLNDDNTIDVEISPGTYVKMEKSAISLEMTEHAQKTLPKDSREESAKRLRYNNRDKSHHNKTDKNHHNRNNRRDNNQANREEKPKQNHRAKSDSKSATKSENPAPALAQTQDNRG